MGHLQYKHPFLARIVLLWFGIHRFNQFHDGYFTFPVIIIHMLQRQWILLNDLLKISCWVSEEKRIYIDNIFAF